MDKQFGSRLVATLKPMELSIMCKRLRILPGIFFCVAVLAGSLAFASEDVDTSRVYQIGYEATLDPETGLARVKLTLDQSRRLVRSIDFHMPSDRYLNVRPASRIEVNGDRVIWRPLKRGSVLRFDFVIDHRRENGLEDARITDTWALLKLDHLFPPARTRVVKGATSKATLKLVAPRGWAVETPFGWGAGQNFEVSDPHRRFDRPLGWLMAGELGVRREKIGDRHVSVASPLGSGLRANDLLAFMRWTMPSLIEVFPDLPPRLLIVSGSRDMWRGGLSGNGSLYLHGDRPLISGNRSSPLLHELVHVASGLHGRGGSDWIVEGLAEYYSLTLLLRSGGISQFRYDKAFDTLARWSAKTPCVATDRSQGKQNAHAALVMRALDTEIRAATGDKVTLDTIVQILVHANEPVTNAGFREAVMQFTNGPVRALAGCP